MLREPKSMDLKIDWSRTEDFVCRTPLPPQVRHILPESGTQIWAPGGFEKIYMGSRINQHDMII